MLGAELLVGEALLSNDVSYAFCSDMMSDVLAYVKEQGVLITGLVNPQVIRTANMMDMVCVIFARGKTPTEEMIELANECGVALMRTGKRSFETCGLLYSAGLERNIEG